MIDVAFLGSHPLGERCLALLEEHPDVNVEVVVTYAADAENWWDGSLASLARDLDLRTLTVDEESRLTEFPVDWLVSVYYPNILGGELLEHPDVGAVNLHQAELPRYRGSNVFSHAIMNARGDDHWRYGTTMHLMVEDVDAGPIVDRRFVDITEEDTARTLYEKTRDASVELFESTLPSLVSGTAVDEATPQSEFDGERYFYTKDSLDDLKEIPLEELTSADADRQLELYDRIRALEFPPHEPAYTRLDGRKVHLTKQSYGGLAE